MDLDRETRQIQKADAHLDKVGALGISFREAIRAAGAGELEEIAIREPGHWGEYHPYDILQQPSNVIWYDPEIIENDIDVYSVRAHEYVHALQYRNAAMLHFNSFEGRLSVGVDEGLWDDEDDDFVQRFRQKTIVLCPRDQIIAVNLEERDAYAKEAWLTALLEQAEPGITRHTKAAASITAAFNQAAAKSGGDLNTTLERAADISWPKRKDRYHDRSLKYYEAIAKKWLKNGRPENVVFVRADEQDHQSVGESFGPNFLKDHKAKTELSVLNWARLKLVNRAFGIKDEQSLPTLAEALGAQGISKEDCLNYFCKYGTSRRPQF